MAMAAGCVTSMQKKAFWLLFLLSILVPVRMEPDLDFYDDPYLRQMIEKYDDHGHVIGIDLGTTYSCIAVYESCNVEIIANRITPSWVAFNDSERFIGEAAEDQAALNLESTLFYVKRFIGRKFDDPEVQREMRLLPFKVVNQDGKPYISVKVKNGGMKLMSPEEICAMMMRKMKQMAESNLGKEIKNAVVAVPAYFTDAQRQATIDSGVIAGLNVVRIINAPTAAAIAYGLHKKRAERNILVLHLSGGTFDVTILNFYSGVFELLSTNGDSHLGGQDFDQNLMHYFVKLIKKRYKKDISNDENALRKLKEECERARRALSTQHLVYLEIESLLDGINLYEPLSRAMFQKLNMNLFKETLEPVKQALKDSGLEKKDIDEIVLVGESTRIPKVRQLLKDFFDGKEPSQWIHPDDFFAGKVLNKSMINPDEAIAHGAAIQGAILRDRCDQLETEEYGSLSLFLFRPRIPFSYGLATLGGVVTKLIPSYSFFPLKKTQVFTTCQDQQTTMSIKIYLGESASTKDCRELGKFNLSGIPPAPKGVPRIEVTFYANEGSVQVTATDKATKKSNIITVNHSKILSWEEMVKFEDEAAEMSDDDKKVRERIDPRNGRDITAYNARRYMKLHKKLGNKLECIMGNEELANKQLK